MANTPEDSWLLIRKHMHIQNKLIQKGIAEYLSPSNEKFRPCVTPVCVCEDIANTVFSTYTSYPLFQHGTIGFNNELNATSKQEVLFISDVISRFHMKSFVNLLNALAPFFYKKGVINPVESTVDYIIDNCLDPDNYVLICSDNVYREYCSTLDFPSYLPIAIKVEGLNKIYNMDLSVLVKKNTFELANVIAKEVDYRGNRNLYKDKHVINHKNMIYTEKDPDLMYDFGNWIVAGELDMVGFLSC